MGDFVRGGLEEEEKEEEEEPIPVEEDGTMVLDLFLSIEASISAAASSGPPALPVPPPGAAEGVAIKSEGTRSEEGGSRVKRGSVRRRMVEREER